MSILGKVIQRLKPITPTAPYLGVELAIDETAIYKRMKLVPYTPDKLVTRKKIDIFNEMILDTEIESSINTLKTIRMASGWEIISASEDERDKEISDFVKWNMDNVEGTLDDDLREIMGAVDLGMSLNELVWNITEYGRYKNKIVLQSIKSRNPKYFNIYTDDFDNIRPDGIVNISSMDYGRQYPTEKFIVYSFNKRYENVFGTSRIRALYDLWFLKQIFIKAWGIFMEKYGIPFPILKHPPLDTETKTGLLTAIKQIRMETGMLIPQGLDFELKDAISRGGQVFIDAFEHINAQMRKTILGQTLSAETGGAGSYALGQVHFDILLFYEEELGKDVSEKAINNQVIKRLVDYNYNNVEEYPKFRFKPLVQRDIEKIIDKYYTGVAQGIIKPIPEDEAQIREWLSFPKRKEEQAPAPAVTEQPETSQTQKEQIFEFQEKLFTGVKRRTFTEYERHTDFTDILDTIEGNTERVVPSIASVIQDSVKDLVEQIAKKRIVEDKNFGAIERLQLKYMGDVKTRFQDMLDRGYKQGMKDARKEVMAKKKNTRFQEIETRHITPKEALEYINSKAYTIAGYEKDFILKKAKTVLENAILTGSTLKDTIHGLETELIPYFEKGLVGDEALMGYRLETVVRTNLNRIYNEGRKMFFQSPELEGYVQAYQYSAILDDRVRPNHAWMDGKIYDVNDPVWDMWSPSNGFNCRCLLAPVTADEEWTESPERPEESGIFPDAGFSKPGTQKRPQR